MMKQVTLFRGPSSIKKPKQNQKEQQIQVVKQVEQLPQKLEYSKDMTIKGKKNSKVKIVTNKKRHNHWSIIFRRKRIMSEYFSDSAFGSQSDTKIEFYNPRDDPELMQKYRALKIFEYDYDENEVMPENLSFIHDPNTYHNNKEKGEDKNNDTSS